MDKRFIIVAPVRYGEGEAPSPEEISSIVYSCWNAGASIVHLHVTDSYGKPTTDLSLFNLTVSLIRKKCDIIIQPSTGAIDSISVEKRALVAEIDEVEQASLNMGSLNLYGTIFENSEEDIRFLAKKLKENGVKPDLEIFNGQMIDLALKLRDEGILLEPLSFQIYIYNRNICTDYGERKIGKISQKQRKLLSELESIPSEYPVSICNHDYTSLSMFALALSMGLNIRIGFEDSRYLGQGEMASDNAQLIEKIVQVMKCFGIEPASTSETRGILGINKNNKEDLV